MQSIAIIGAPLGIGAGTQGASLGPDAIRLAGLHETLTRLGRDFIDAGNLPSLEEPYPPQEFPPFSIRYLDEIETYLRALKDQVFLAASQNMIPLVLGGDHSIAIGSLAAMAKFHHHNSTSAGLIWFDAHADVNSPESTPSGNLHGMPLSLGLGQGEPRLLNLFEGHHFSPERTVLFGVRSVDSLEGTVLQKLGVHVITMKDLDESGTIRCIRYAIDKASPANEPIHLSFDIDGVDAMSAPGTGTPVDGGVTLREAHLLLEVLAEKNILASMDLAEVNPLLDLKNQTGRAAKSLIGSAFGQVIY
jgi:arginase